MTCPFCEIEMEEVASNTILTDKGTWDTPPEYEVDWIDYRCKECGYTESWFNPSIARPRED